MSALDQVVEFVGADPEDRFMTITYSPHWPVWEVAICLGDQTTCDGPRVIEGTRWLQNYAGTLDGALEQVVKRLPTVRPLAKGTKR